MELLIDLFGYLSIIVHGLTILAQSMALGGVLFLVFLARPLSGSIGTGVSRRTATLAAWSACGLVAAEAATVALQAAVLMGTLDLGFVSALTSHAALAGIVKIVASEAAPIVAINGLPFQGGIPENTFQNRQLAELMPASNGHGE